jgi:hypothetical protein
VVGEAFVRMWTSALAHCHERFEGKGYLFSREPSGGIGCFTPDSFPVFHTFRQNAYVIADSNHGYKMIGVGALVAKEIMDEPQELLDPFYCNRYELAAFTREAWALGVSYFGLCCGAAPHHIRSIAEALDRTPPASRYSEDMSKHVFLGTDPTLRRQNIEYRSEL